MCQMNVFLVCNGKCQGTEDENMHATVHITTIAIYPLPGSAPIIMYSAIKFKGILPLSQHFPS